MKLAIVGSRSIRSFNLQPHIRSDTTHIITGGADGIDTIAEQYASASGLTLTIIRPDYLSYGRRAPLLRNVAIAKACDAMLAVWDGQSSGTAHALEQARRDDRPTTTITVPSNGT